jgi:hypothetical protein
MADTKALDDFRRRMIKLNIDIKFGGNYPWIYIDAVNGNRIREEDYYLGDHGFTVAFLPLKPGKKMELTDITKIFKLIRKYR